MHSRVGLFGYTLVKKILIKIAVFNPDYYFKMVINEKD